MGKTQLPASSTDLLGVFVRMNRASQKSDAPTRSLEIATPERPAAPVTGQPVVDSLPDCGASPCTKQGAAARSLLHPPAAAYKGVAGQAPCRLLDPGHSFPVAAGAQTIPDPSRLSVLQLGIISLFTHPAHGQHAMLSLSNHGSNGKSPVRPAPSLSRCLTLSARLRRARPVYNPTSRSRFVPSQPHCNDSVSSWSITIDHLLTMLV